LLFLMALRLVLSWLVFSWLVLGLLVRGLLRNGFCLGRFGGGRGWLSFGCRDRRLDRSGSRWRPWLARCRYSFPGRPFRSHRRLRRNRCAGSRRSAGQCRFWLAAALLGTGSQLTRSAHGSFFLGGASASWWRWRGRRLGR